MSFVVTPITEPRGSTLLGSADFRRFTGGQIPVVYQSTLSVNDINYDSNRDFKNGIKQSNNSKFIELWNSGIPVITISGSSSFPFDDIIRQGSYNLLARASILVNYTFTPPPESPLPSTPPIQLNDIQSKFNAASLEGSRINAGFSSPAGMLDFLGAGPTPQPTTDQQRAGPSAVFGSPSWSWSGFSYASTGPGSSPVNAVSFLFGSSSISVIPSDATINFIVARVENGAITGDTGVLAPAAMWFEDFFDNSSISPPPDPPSAFE